MKCSRCGQDIGTEGASFCPFCGNVLQKTDTDTKVDEWLRKIRNTTSIPERKKVIEKAMKDCPDQPELEWEYLFIGHEKKQKRMRVDFSIIKSFLLYIWLTPKEFDRNMTEEMRTELFEDPQLIRCLDMADDRDKCMNEYLHRLCAEFIEVFLDGDTRFNRSLFGLRLDNRREKWMANPAATVILNIRADPMLTDDRKQMLVRNFYQAFSEATGGKTSWLDAALGME